MTRPTSSLALAALLASFSANALAQSYDEQSGDQPALQEPQSTEAAATAPPEIPARPVQGQIRTQEKDTMLSKDLVGAEVQSPQQERLGDVNDLIIASDGRVEGLVIGVGGILGFGEKDVAVELEALEIRPEESGQLLLVLDATQIDMEAAPAFKTAAALQAEQAVEAAQSQQLETLQDAELSGSANEGNSSE